MFRSLLTILSLLGLLASIVLWAMSFCGFMYLGKHLTVYGSHHSLRLHWHLVENEYGPAYAYDPWVSASPGYLPKSQKALPQITSRTLASGHRVVTCYVPLWLLVIVCGSVFLWCRPTYYFRQRLRRKLGLCLRCGYDLRASEVRCPECGAAFERERKEAARMTRKKEPA